MTNEVQNRNPSAEENLVTEPDILNDARLTPGPESPAWLAAMGEADKITERLLEYSEFLNAKIIRAPSCGFHPGQLNPKLFPFQSDIVRWAVRKGRCALFEDCGLGKTFQQLEWARLVHKHTAKPVLIFAPLGVTHQTPQEARKFGEQEVTICAVQTDIQPGVNITNYEKLSKFSPDGIGGIVLDESSILKGFDGTTRKTLTAFAAAIPYRLPL